MTSLCAFPFGDQLLQVIFTRLSAHRLRSAENSIGPEPVDVLHCSILDEDLSVVAVGRAICAADDTFSLQKGMVLSLARACDYAEAHTDNWTDDYSDDMMALLFGTNPSCQPIIPDSVQIDAPTDYRNISQVKTIVPFIGAPVPLDPWSGGQSNETIAREATHVVPRRLKVAPTLALNDHLRIRAKSVGVNLNSSVGALSMTDLSRLYHALSGVAA